jgi:predicted nucleotidyltransferase
MNILEWAARISKDQKLEFLVIGGHAVNAYGYARETADVDFLVRKEDRSGWEAAFVSIGYTIFRDAPTFLQLSAPEGSAWPVDLMFVSDRTFQPMLAEAKEMDTYLGRIRIPAVEHLIALKLHALKHARLDRFLKDFQDVVGMIDCNQLDPTSEKVRRLFEKYGTVDLYEKVLRSLL